MTRRFSGITIANSLSPITERSVTGLFVEHTRHILQSLQVVQSVVQVVLLPRFTNVSGMDGIWGTEGSCRSAGSDCMLGALPNGRSACGGNALLPAGGKALLFAEGNGALPPAGGNALLFAGGKMLSEGGNGEPPEEKGELPPAGGKRLSAEGKVLLPAGGMDVLPAGGKMAGEQYRQEGRGCPSRGRGSCQQGAWEASARCHQREGRCFHQKEAWEGCHQQGA